MLLDVFNNLESLNTLLILVIMLLEDNNIFKKLTSGIMDSLTGFQDNLVQSWWPDFPIGVTGHHQLCDRGNISISKQDKRQWHSWFPTGLLLFHTDCLLGHQFNESDGCAPGLLRHRVPLVDRAVLSTSGITRSGRSAKSGRPSASGVELRPAHWKLLLSLQVKWILNSYKWNYSHAWSFMCIVYQDCLTWYDWRSWK